MAADGQAPRAVKVAGATRGRPRPGAARAVARSLPLLNAPLFPDPPENDPRKPHSSGHHEHDGQPLSRYG